MGSLNDPGRTRIRIGLDLGQIRDYTAITITEEVRRQRQPHFLVRTVERLPLGTPYPKQADRVAEIVAGLQTMRRMRKANGEHGFSRIELFTDTTGVGVAVADLLRERRLKPILITLVGHDRVVVHPEDGRVSIGKAYLVSRLQVLMQNGQLHFPDGLAVGALVKELQNYRIEISDTGHASFNARSGEHDDMVISLGLSVGWEDGKRKRAAPLVTSIARDPMSKIFGDARGGEPVAARVFKPGRSRCQGRW